MTTGFPVETDTTGITTTVIDNTPVFSTSVRQDFPIEKKFREGDNIYINTKGDISVVAYDGQVTYESGSLVFGDPYSVGSSSLYEVKDLVGESVPLQPQNYNNGTNPTDVEEWDYTKWTKRYLKVGNYFLGDDKTIEISMTLQSSSTLVSFNYIFTKMDDGTVQVKAVFSNGAESVRRVPIVSDVLPLAQEDEASIHNYQDVTFWLPNYFIQNSSGVYIRTNIDTSIEYTAPATENVFYKKTYVSEIDGFSYLEKNNWQKPFDYKNYSIAEANGSLYYKFKSKGKFNSIALGRIICSEAIIKISKGSELIQVSREVNTDRDINGILDQSPVTEVFYFSNDLQTMYDETYDIEVILHNREVVDNYTIYKDVQIGSIIPTQAVDAGITNISLSNSGKDFSTHDVDIFGNVDRVEREKISTHKGTVEFPVTDYDMTDRLMLSLLGRLIVIDAADNYLVEAGEKSKYTAFQKIGYTRTYAQSTSTKNDELSKFAKYTFSFEEIA